jgi:exodeoxyribonuclease X
MAKAILFDTETTGFNDPEVIEAAWVELFEKIESDTDLNQDMTEYVERFQPSKAIELGALATHHILDEELVGLRPSAEFKLPNGVEYLVGHNIDFDWRVIGCPPIKRICTLALARWLWPDLDSHTQTALMYFASTNRMVTRTKASFAHSALHDVRNCLPLLYHMIYCAELSTAVKLETWEDLWQLSELARIPTKMPFGKYRGELISGIPSSYVTWLMKQPDLDPYLMGALKRRVW